MKLLHSQISGSLVALGVFGLPIYCTLVAVIYASAYLEKFGISSSVVPITVEPATLIMPAVVILATTVVIILLMALYLLLNFVIDLLVDRIMRSERIAQVINLLTFILPVIGTIVVIISTYDGKLVDTLPVMATLVSLSFVIYSGVNYYSTTRNWHKLHEQILQVETRLFWPGRSRTSIPCHDISSQSTTISKLFKPTARKISVALSIIFLSSLIIAHQVGANVAQIQQTFPEVTKQGNASNTRSLIIYRSGDKFVVKEYDEQTKSFLPGYRLIDMSDTLITPYQIP